MKNFITNFRKQKFVSSLNIITLSLGVMVAVLVSLWSLRELSFDRFHDKKDRIYRIITHFTYFDRKVATTFNFYATQAKETLSFVEDACRVYVQNFDVNINDAWYPTPDNLIVDSNFFSFFSFPLIEGVPEHVLSSPDKVVISEDAATKYFPQQNPIGQIVKFYDQDFVVSGIMKNIPKNSSLQADFIFPLFKMFTYGNDQSCNAFLLLHEGIMADKITGQVQQILNQAAGCDDEENCAGTISLESLNDLYFDTDLSNEMIIRKGNKSLVIIYMLTSLIILIISCINFANLFVATSFIRAKTVGIKKCFGAGKNQLMFEFYIETACYVIVSIILGLWFAKLVLPLFNNFTQSSLSIDFTSLLLYGLLTGLFFFTVLLAGSFPALYMTRFDVSETISRKFKGKPMSFFQKGLMIFQFSASIVLLLVVVFMQKQIDYMISHDLGFDSEHVVYVYSRPEVNSDFNLLRNELLKEPSIIDIARKRDFLYSRNQTQWVGKVFSEDEHFVPMDITPVSSDFFDVLGMEFIGENLLNESFLESDVVINERGVELLGLEQPVGQTVSVGGNDKTIKGVIKNAYTRSFHHEIEPQVFMKMNDDWSWWSVVYFKISGNPQKALSVIGQYWKERDPNYPYTYYFMDDTYKQFYTSEMNAGKVFSFTMLITFIITVSGLFAMAYYAIQRRIREIALRKVHGASVSDIFVLLNKGLLLLAVISFVIACPVAYFGLQKWLDDFVVQTSLSLWVFLLTGLIVFIIILLTTGYHTWKVATENPVKALKTE